MFVYQVCPVRVQQDAKIVEAFYYPLQLIAADKLYYNLLPLLPNMIQELILNVNAVFYHIKTVE